MRISDWSSDVCSSDLFARSTPDHRNIIHRVLLSTPTSKIAGRMERRPRHQLRTPARYETLAQRGCEYDDRDRYLPQWTRDRKGVVRGNSVSVRVENGGRRASKKTNPTVREDDR